MRKYRITYEYYKDYSQIDAPLASNRFCIEGQFSIDDLYSIIHERIKREAHQLEMNDYDINIIICLLPERKQ